MKQKVLKHYLDQEWQQARGGLERFAREGNGEALHQFRIHVKRLKALVQLLVYKQKKERVKKIIQPLRRLFQQAGTVRDAGLLLDLGRTYHAPPTLLREQEQKMAVAARELQLTAKAPSRLFKEVRRNLLLQLKKIHRRQIRIFYRDRLRNIAADLDRKDAVTRLHDCRKQIKALLYNHKLVRKALDIPLNRPYLKALETAIGNWHDHLLAARKLPVLKAKHQGLLKHVLLLSDHFATRVLEQ